MMVSFQELYGQSDDEGCQREEGCKDTEADQLCGVEHPVGRRQGVIDKGITGQFFPVDGLAGVKYDDQEDEEDKDIGKSVDEKDGARVVEDIVLAWAMPEDQNEKNITAGQDDPEIVIADDVEQLDTDKAGEGAAMVGTLQLNMRGMAGDDRQGERIALRFYLSKTLPLKNRSKLKRHQVKASTTAPSPAQSSRLERISPVSRRVSWFS